MPGGVVGAPPIMEAPYADSEHVKPNAVRHAGSALYVFLRLLWPLCRGWEKRSFTVAQIVFLPAEAPAKVSPPQVRLRISVIVDAHFSLIVDGETASSRARRGGAQVRVVNVAQSSTISLKPASVKPGIGLVFGLR